VDTNFHERRLAIVPSAGISSRRNPEKCASSMGTNRGLRARSSVQM